jgi:membrane fusion protein (multidrug efflux system)
MRSLERQRRPWLWLAPALLLLGAWSLWMARARVDVYASAARARVEVHGIANRVAALDGGRIVMLRCELGRLVQEGEVLAELDSSVERAELAQGRAQLASLSQKLAAVQKQIQAEHAKRLSRLDMDELAAQGGDYALQQARVSASHQAELTSIAQQLNQGHVLARVDAVTADAELAKTRLQLDRATIEAGRLRAAQQYEARSELARIAELQRQLAELEAERQVQSASLALVQTRLERRALHAPVSGRLGNIASLQVGDVVKAGDVLATVVPDEDVHIVAEFAPADAVGRILPGQPARVRLNGFSWLEFGMLEAQVRHVASEPRDGTIRVELLIGARRLARVPVQHGLPGSVDVRIDRATPWSLLLRSVGGKLLRGADHAPYLAQGSEP